ncbi:M23 family metallopeptidase [Agromyces mediolanus]|nr:M23 family metallopeptidase [Agromyces mediolanus]
MTEPPLTRRALREAERSRPRRHRASPAPRAARRRLLPTLALTSAALMLASTTLPAFSAGPAGATATPATVTAGEEPQDVIVGPEVAQLDLQRDSYTAGKAATSGDYAQTAATFVNYSGAIQWPFLTGVPISTDFGPRIPPCAGCSSYHKGIDMNPGDGSPIQAIAAGVVREVSASDNGGLGVYAVIDHVVDGQLVSSVYAHMREGSLALSVGETVAVGDLVGKVGNTGQSTGPHLHLEILLDGTTPTDPVEWLSERVVP